MTQRGVVLRAPPPGQVSSCPGRLIASRQEPERSRRWPHHSEVAAIEGRDFPHVETLGRGHDGRVHSPKRQVSVGRNEFGDPEPVRCRDSLWDEIAGGEVADEPHLGIDADARAEEVGHLGDDELRDDERAGVRLQKVQALGVVAVVEVDVGVERTSVDDQCDAGTSAARISSIRSEISD